MSIDFTNFESFSEREERFKKEQEEAQQKENDLTEKDKSAIKDFRKKLKLKDEDKPEIRICNWRLFHNDAEYDKFKEEVGAERIITDNRANVFDIANSKKVVLNEDKLKENGADDNKIKQLNFAIKDRCINAEGNQYDICNGVLCAVLEDLTYYFFNEGEYHFEYDFKDPKFTKYLEENDIVIHFNI